MTASHAEPNTRTSLLVRLADPRDDAAWADFTAVYEPVIYGMTRRRGMQDADAREIVQEVLLAVSRHVADFDSSAGGSFRGWLSQVTRNATIDRLRSITARRETIDQSGAIRRHDEITASAPDDKPIAEEFERDRRRQLFHWAAGEARRRTGEVNWIAFWRTCVEGHEIAKVAADLGLAEGAVYVARCRILRRIRQLVDERETE